MDFQIHRLTTVDSTMNRAAGMALGSVIVADEQTAGIGRHGHAWASPAGTGLYVSVVLEPHPVLTLALGLAAQAAIRQVTSIACDIRWPNDLLLNERKVGGILARMEGALAVAGIGINIGQRSFPPDLARLATSLALETNLDFRSEDILQALLVEIQRHVKLSASDVLAQWEQASTYARGKAVQVELGDRAVTGVTDGLDASGFLRIRTADGSVETVLAGGVRPAGTATI